MRVERAGSTVSVSAPVGDTRVVVNLVVPGPAGDIPFHGMVVARDGIAQRPLTLDAHYCVPGLEAFLRMARDGKPPIAYEDLLRPIRVLDAVSTALPPEESGTVPPGK